MANDVGRSRIVGDDGLLTSDVTHLRCLTRSSAVIVLPQPQPRYYRMFSDLPAPKRLVGGRGGGGGKVRADGHQNPNVEDM